MPTDEFLKNDAFLTTELLKLAVEAAGIGVWKVDPQTRNVELTAVLKRMLGIPVDQPVNYAAFFAALHPDDQAQARDDLARALTAPFDAEGRVRRLMRRMGLAAVYQKPRTSVPHPEHVVYPYLLRNLTIDRANQVWCADITYIPMRRGFLYLVAVMDWASRKVLSWRVSNTMETDFCIAAVEEAIARFGAPDLPCRMPKCAPTSSSLPIA